MKLVCAVGLPVLLLIALGARVDQAASARQRTPTFPLPAGQTFTNTGRQLVSVSPDGTQLVYVANTRLFLARIGSDASREIAGTLTPQGLTNPVFSPDGRAIAYWSAADQTVKRIPVEGGSAVTLFAGGNPFGMSWTADDRILVAQGQAGIVSAPAMGGAASTVVAGQADEVAVTPVMLPGRNVLVFSVVKLPGGPDTGTIVAQDLASGSRTTLVQGGRDPRYLASGHLVFARGTSLLAVRFDIARLQVSGEPVVVAENVQPAGNGSSHFSVSSTGTLAYVPPPENYLRLASVALDGNSREIGRLPANTFAPRVSPDGRTLVYNTQGVDEAVYFYDLASGATRQLTTRARGPLWSLDGTRVYYIAGDANDEKLYSHKADGSEPPELLVDPARAPESWSRRDELLSFITLKTGATADYDIWTYSPRERKARPAIEVPGSAQHSSRFSPDGRHLAYVSNESGDYEVYVQPFPATGAKYRISSGGGLHPVWSPDGRRLYFDRGERLFAVSVETAPSFRSAAPEAMPIAGFLAGAVNTRRRYDMTPDGRAFLMMFPPPRQITIVPAWADDIRARVK